MNKISLLFQRIVVFSLTFYLANITQIAAQSKQLRKNHLKTAKVTFIQPNLVKKPENRGAPKERTGAGTRGECPTLANKPKLTGLVPLMQITDKQKQLEATNTLISEFVLGLTVSEYPTFWFYVPYLPKDIKFSKFILLDENKNSVMKEPLAITISEIPGVISVQIPKTEKALEIGKYYHWYFVINCNSQGNSEDTAVEGLVKRIDPNPDLERRLQLATPKERVGLYAEAGIWQDAISLLGELRRTQPQDSHLVSDWQDLLESIDLNSVMNEPITPCCALNN
ncbi:DUF928 domain-containing protein [Nostoc sp. CALU 546]|uniref:DUF928 domain-containing protein n=1 Tax=Nostoc sp. CALU 546 TaxID=1867241 RepID=UPI003B683123